MKAKQKKGNDYHSRTGSFAVYGEGTICIRCRRKVKRDIDSVNPSDPYSLYCSQCRLKIKKEEIERVKSGKPW